ncbi:MAG: hypothetical protein GY757_18780 [bacterium]|nr:hypothetical protein [bacterium]
MSVLIETTGGVSVVGEKTTPSIQVVFTDEAGDAVVPTGITWSLADVDGTIINSRIDVAIATPASTINLTLTEADTTLQGRKRYYGNHDRYITFRAVYNSALGNDLVAIEEGMFSIENFRSE